MADLVVVAREVLRISPVVTGYGTTKIQRFTGDTASSRTATTAMAEATTGSAERVVLASCVATVDAKEASDGFD